MGAVGALVTLVALAVPATAVAASTSQVSLTVSGALKGTLKQSPVIACLPGPMAVSGVDATFTIEGKLHGGGPTGTLYILEVATSSLKGGTWALGPSSKARATFVEQISKELYWTASSGKLTTSSTSGSINAKLVPEKAAFTPKGAIDVKGSWKC
jgi:hypothetical protein